MRIMRRFRHVVLRCEGSCRNMPMRCVPHHPLPMLCCSIYRAAPVLCQSYHHTVPQPALPPPAVLTEGLERDDDAPLHMDCAQVAVAHARRLVMLVLMLDVRDSARRVQ